MRMSVHAFDSSQVVGEAGTDAGQHVARFENMFVCSTELARRETFQKRFEPPDRKSQNVRLCDAQASHFGPSVQLLDLVLAGA
eukprot:s2640_g3.t1